MEILPIDYGLAGKRALITGGTHGIGFETVKLLSLLGCEVAYLSSTKGKLDQVATWCGQNGFRRNLPIQCNVLDKDDCKRATDFLIENWGMVDILVNNVGGGGRWGTEKPEDAENSVWEEVFQKNAGAAIHFTTTLYPLMQKNGWGRVITVASLYGKDAGGRPWFNVAKAAQIALMKNLSKQTHIVRDGVTFNTVSPGGIFIIGTGAEDEQNLDPAKFEEIVARDYPLGRMGLPEEVAYLIVFLASKHSDLINGAQIPIDGGQSASY